MPATFCCQQTGKCCSHIRGFVSDLDRAFLKEYAYGKLPLVALCPPEEISFPLWDWEAKRFIAKAEELGIDHKIKPSRVILDLNTNAAIIVTYSVFSDACTFLKDNKCSIYNDRGFVCKLFPFQHGPFLKTGEKLRKEDMFGGCPSITHIVPELNDADDTLFIRQLHESFGESFLAVVQSDLVTEWINSKIVYLMKNRLIRPAINYPYDKFLARVANAPKVDFTEFMIQHAVISKGDMEKYIKRFEKFEDAKEKIAPYLQ